MPDGVHFEREPTGDRERLLGIAVRVANVGLACGCALAVLVFVYFFYWYSVTGQRQFTSPSYVVVFYVLPLIVAAALLAALRLLLINKMIMLKLFVVSGMAFYVMVMFLKCRASSLYGRALPVMTVLALADSSDRQGYAAALEKEWGTQVDLRVADDILDALRRTDPDAVPIITSSNHL